MHKLIFTTLLIIIQVGLLAQPNIYSENDIAFQSLFMDAQIQKHKGNTEKEIEILKDIIKRDNNSGAAHYELARAYASTENYEQAQKYALKATSIDASNNWYLLTLAQVYESSEQYEKATQAYTKLIELDEKNPVLYHRLSVNQLHINKPKEAATTLELLQKRTSITEETSRRLFDIYSKSGMEDKALQTLNTLTTVYPDNERFLQNLGSYLHDLGRIDESNNVFKNLLAINPDNTAANIAISKAMAKMSKGDNNSLDYISTLIPLVDNMEIPLDNKIQELMPYLSKIQKGDPNITSLITISEKLIMNYPTDAKVHAVRGDVMFYSGDMEASEKAYEKAITIDNRKYTLWDQWMINLWQNDKLKKLESVSYDALDYFPNQVNAFVIHAIALTRNNKIGEADGYLDEAGFIAGKSQSLKDAVQIGKYWSHISENDKQELSTFLSNLNHSDLSNPLYLELIGDLYESADDQKNSKKLWETAIDFGAKESRLKKKIGT